MLLIKQQKPKKLKKKQQLNHELISSFPDFSKTGVFSYSAQREMDQDEKLPRKSLNLKPNLKCTVRERLVQSTLRREQADFYVEWLIKGLLYLLLFLNSPLLVLMEITQIRHGNLNTFRPLISPSLLKAMLSYNLLAGFFLNSFFLS